MDECKAANIWGPNQIGSKILVKGRKRNFFLLVVIQKVKGVPPVVRANMRFFVLTGGGQTNADDLYEEYLSSFFGSSHHPKAFFKRVFAAVTAVRGRVIIVDTQPPFDGEDPDRANGLSDHMFWYRADSADLPPPGTLKMEPTVSPAVLSSGDDVQAEAEEDAQVESEEDEITDVNVDSFGTPQCIKDDIDIILSKQPHCGVVNDFDPCPYEPNWTEGVHTDGLTLDFPADGTFTVVNPPYTKLNGSKGNPGWLEKCHQESLRGARVVLVLPSNRMATLYWKAWVTDPGHQMLPLARQARHRLATRNF